ncbi:MAG: CopD family protein [Gammaproteobacteria bacterium]|nr:CopD family protein [Gammaproteobacteria bacterium]
MPVAIALHLVAAVIWVGGMFFAYMALRPAAASMEPALRLPLWSRTFGRFFPWVWMSVIALPATGYWMISDAFGGMAHAGMRINIMQTLGIIMIMIYLHLFFAPYRRLNRAVAAGDFAAAGLQLAQIRRLIGINLLLGLVTIVVASAGRYWR